MSTNFVVFGRSAGLLLDGYEVDETFEFFQRQYERNFHGVLESSGIGRPGILLQAERIVRV